MKPYRGDAGVLVRHRHRLVLFGQPALILVEVCWEEMRPRNVSPARYAKSLSRRQAFGMSLLFTRRSAKAFLFPISRLSGNPVADEFIPNDFFVGFVKDFRFASVLFACDACNEPVAGVAYHGAFARGYFDVRLNGFSGNDDREFAEVSFSIGVCLRYCPSCVPSVLAMMRLLVRAASASSARLRCLMASAFSSHAN